MLYERSEPSYKYTHFHLKDFIEGVDVIEDFAFFFLFLVLIRAAIHCSAFSLGYS